MILHSYVEQVMTMCRVQEWQLSLSYFPDYFPLMVSDAISCPLHNSNTPWYIIMILYNFVEQTMTMCRVQEWQLSLSYFLSFSPWLFRMQFRVLSIFENSLIYYHDILQLYRTGLDDVLNTRMTTLIFILSELFPLDGFRYNFMSAP